MSTLELAKQTDEIKKVILDSIRSSITGTVSTLEIYKKNHFEMVDIMYSVIQLKDSGLITTKIKDDHCELTLK